MHAPLPTPARLSLGADGSVEGYASLFGEIDQARDMVMPGAFAKTLQQRGLRKIPMLFQHDPAEPVGVWLELIEDLRGLRARGRLIPDVARGRELLALLRAGAIDGLSIGYRTVRGAIDPRTRVRRLYQVDLWEISIVTFPLLAGARVNAVKDAPRVSQLREAAEREWRSLQVSGAADAPAPPARRGRNAVTLASRADRKRAFACVARGGL
ncbi:MAG: HK97 family phage prohead protease [Rhodopseudomonas sp.]|uniref:HK97 family phage prohead protease n=1 Tax=Rhodopseudomonas sp. TaxID=1078 RepID=UPI0017D0C7C6|nr:HK97 family phage prohead protease [Rhodopseudomonas sp.]NVN87022.1 HK97 family phage prohead protease [Rhodopseudomonas sp.]